MREAESRESERGRGQTEQWRLGTRAESREKGKILRVLRGFICFVFWSMILFRTKIFVFLVKRMCRIIFVIHLKLPNSFLKFWDLGALGNCITQLPKGRAGPVCIGVVGFDYIG